MERSFLVLTLLLSLGLLTTSIPYGGVKGSSRWKFKQEKSDVGFPDPKKEPEYGSEKDVGNVGSETGGKDLSVDSTYGEEKVVDQGGSETGGKDFSVDSTYGDKTLNAKEEAETAYSELDNTGKEPDLGYESASDKEKSGSDYVPDLGPIEKLDPSYSPDSPGSPKDSGLDYVPEGTGSDYVPEEKGSDYVPEGTSSDYVPEGKDSGYVPEGKDSGYTPDKVTPLEETNPDYKPDFIIPREETGSDYVPEKETPYAGADSDYSPDKVIPDKGIDSDYVPPKEKSPKDTGSDYVPEDIKPNEGGGSEYSPDQGISTDYLPPKEISPKDTGSGYKPDEVIEELEEEYVPEKGVTHEKGGGSGYDSAYKGTYKDTEYSPEKDETYKKDYDHSDSESFVEKLKRKWSEFSDHTKEAAHSVGRAIHSAVEEAHGKFSDLWHKFTKVLSGFGYEIQRGARYVFTVVSTSIEEVKASALISKLEKRLEEGNEIVDKFFQQVGQKMTHYAQQHNHENVDEGLFLDNQQSKDKNFMDIFQDHDIHKQVEKMVDGGVITQEEADLLSQIKQTKDEVGLDVSPYDAADQHQGSGSYGNLDGNIEQVGDSGSYVDQGSSYGTEGKVDQVSDLASYDNQDAKPHHTTKKELEQHSKGYGRKDQKTINFPDKW